MSDTMFLFTLHEGEDDFRITGSVLARNPQEAASILGGEFIEVEGWPPGSSTNRDDLNLRGKIRFAPELFRRFSSKELNAMKLDFDPGPFYEKQPGFVIWEGPDEEGGTFVLRRYPVCMPDYLAP